MLLIANICEISSYLVLLPWAAKITKKKLGMLYVSYDVIMILVDPCCKVYNFDISNLFLSGMHFL